MPNVRLAALRRLLARLATRLVNQLHPALMPLAMPEQMLEPMLKPMEYQLVFCIEDLRAFHLLDTEEDIPLHAEPAVV